MNAFFALMNVMSTNERFIYFGKRSVSTYERFICIGERSVSINEHFFALMNTVPSTVYVLTNAV